MMDRREAVYRGTELISETFREVSWHQVRAARDQALVDTDWRALKDVTLTTAWRDYRSALRDLPQNHSESNDAADAFPEAPE